MAEEQHKKYDNWDQVRKDSLQEIYAATAAGVSINVKLDAILFGLACLLTKKEGS